MSIARWVATRLQQHAVFYGWNIVAAGAVSNFIIVGFATLGLGVYLNPMREEMGWTVVAISVGFSLKTFEHGLLSPFAGYLVDRLGPRTMALVGVMVLTLGLLLFSQSRELWVYYTAAAVISLGQSIGGGNCFSLAIMNWFRKKRGRAIGINNSGNGLGYLSIPILAALVVAMGWREAVMITAVFVFAVGMPMAMVIRRHPEPYGYLPDGELPKSPRSEQLSGDGRLVSAADARDLDTGLTVVEALRTPAFWLLILASGAASSSGQAWILLQVPHLQNVGFSTAMVGLIVGPYAIFQLVARIISGWLADILGRRQVFVISFILNGLGMIVFANLSPSRLWLLPLYFLSFGLGQAARLVLTTTIPADYFGTKRYATIRGLMGSLQTPMGVASPIIAARMFDTTGTYNLIFTIYGAMALVGGVFAFLARPPKWPSADQKKATASRPAQA